LNIENFSKKKLVLDLGMGPKVLGAAMISLFWRGGENEEERGRKVGRQV
jgi:hypothetical protein